MGVRFEEWWCFGVRGKRRKQRGRNKHHGRYAGVPRYNKIGRGQHSITRKYVLS